MPDSLQPVTSATAARYKYYTVDILSNIIIGEIPFEDVSYENSLKQSGAFDGKITVSSQTDDLDLYRTTLPGRTALYVVRDNVCVWGGIIWGRSYDLTGRSLTVTASEFTSYLNHRLIWKTYASSFVGAVSRDHTGFAYVGVSGRELKSPPPLADQSGSKNTAYLTFQDRSVTKFNGPYTLAGVADGAPADPTIAGFYVNLPKLPKPKNGTYNNVGVALRADTYEYVRELINNAFEDFIDIDFANEIIAPGIAKAVPVIAYKIDSTGTYTGVGTLYTSRPHKLAPGQTIELANIHELLSGHIQIKDIPSPYSFTVPIDSPKDPGDKSLTLEVESRPYTEVSAVKDKIHYREIINSVTRHISHLQRTAGTVTLTTTTKHKFKKGDVISINIENKAPANRSVGGKSINTFDYTATGGNTFPVESAGTYTITFTDPISAHASSAYNIPKTAVANTKANTVEFATPRVQFKLYPRDSHGYIPGDRVRISGVDDIGWKTPLYDGYNQVVESDPGTPRTISAYSAIDDDDIVILYFTTDPEFDIHDYITVSGTYEDIKGTHQIAKVTEPNTSDSGMYEVSIIRIINKDVSKTSVYNVTAAIRGSGWITFDPNYDQLSTVALVEPNSVAQIKQMMFDTGSVKDRAGIVYTDTVDRHGFRVGDVVNVDYTDSATNKVFGAHQVVVKGNSDNDTIVYGIKDSDVPRNSVNKVTKKGTITRTKAILGGTPIVESQFRQIYTDGNLVTVVSEGHNFSIGDNIIVSFASKGYDIYDSGTGSVKIVDVQANSFSYYAPGDIGTSSKVIIKQVDFPTAKIGTKNIVTIRVVTDNLVETTTDTVTGDPVPVSHPAKEIIAFNTDVGAGIDYVNYITNGVNTGYKVGDTVTVTGFPDLVGETTEPNIRSSANLNPYKIEFKRTGTNVGYAYFYTDLDPLLQISEYVTFSGFITQKVAIGAKLANSAMWNFQTKTNKDKSPLTSTIRRKVETITSTINGKATKLGYGFVKDTSGDIVNFYIKVKISGVWNVNWTWDSSKAGHGTDRGVVQIDAKTIPGVKVTKTMTQYSKFNVTDATVARVENGGEKFSVKMNTGISIKDNVLTSTLGGNVTAVVTSLTASEKVLSTTGASTEAPEVNVGDTFKVSGLKDVGVNKYSRLNGKSYPVLKVDPFPDPKTSTGQRRYSTVWIQNPLVNASTKVVTKYAQGVFKEETAVATSFHNVSGLAVLDYSTVSTETREVTAVYRGNATTATLTSPGHGMEVGDWVNIWVYGKETLALNGNNQPIQISSVTEDTITYTIPSDNTCEVNRYSVARNIASNVTTVVLTVAAGDGHRFMVGDTVTLSSFQSTLAGQGFSGDFILTAATPKSLAFTTTATGITTPVTITKAMTSTGTVTLKTPKVIDAEDDGASLGVIIPSPMVVKEPMAFTRTYGEYASNAGLGGIEFSTSAYSQLVSKNLPLRGTDLTNLGSHLEQYSNNLNGFDYRIECKLITDSVTGNKKFKRIFKLIPIYPSTLTSYIKSLPLQDDPYDPNSGVKVHALAPGQVAPPTAFGADKIVFEYPGNISNINLSESAENSATRIFVSSSDGKAAGDGAAYSGASAEDLLADGWPLLDRSEKADWPLVGYDRVNIDNWGNYDSELDLFKTAKRFVYESKPPAGNFIVTVNGSLNPVIGSYSPGDWCSIIVNDPFIKTRLQSKLEPRKDVIIRKIDSIKVTVPNNPAFPEQIDLSIVPDWQVDRIGE